MAKDNEQQGGNANVPFSQRGFTKSTEEQPFSQRSFAEQKNVRVQYSYSEECDADTRRAERRAEKAAKKLHDETAQPAQDCDAFLQELHAQRTLITMPGVQQQLDAIEQQVQGIFAWRQTHDSDGAQTRRLDSYYLPTTLKLLRTFNDMNAHAKGSAVAEKIRIDIIGALQTISAALAGLQNSLLASTALDVSSEISALETVLSQEGLRDDGITDTIEDARSAWES